jgi:hypothetical protein
VVDGSGLENRQGASPRGFESHPLRGITDPGVRYAHSGL